jgi:hypothetical protein
VDDFQRVAAALRFTGYGGVSLRKRRRGSRPARPSPPGWATVGLDLRPVPHGGSSPSRWWEKPLLWPVLCTNLCTNPSRAVRKCLLRRKIAPETPCLSSVCASIIGFLTLRFRRDCPDLLAPVILHHEDLHVNLRCRLGMPASGDVSGPLQ